jgi:excisionase family DNA binding protein
MAAVVEPEVFDVAQASAYMHLNQDGVRDLLKTGELAGWRTLGPNRGNWRIRRATCDEWIALQEERGRMELAQ